MKQYINTSASCQSQENNCSCWSELNDLTKAVRTCNIGQELIIVSLGSLSVEPLEKLKKNQRFISLAKESENLLQPDYVNCKEAFINCSKLQDTAIDYMVGCYTSITGVKTNAKKLLEVEEATTKLKTSQESLVSENSLRVVKDDNSVKLTCAEYIAHTKTLQTVRHFKY